MTATMHRRYFLLDASDTHIERYLPRRLVLPWHQLLQHCLRGCIHALQLAKAVQCEDAHVLCIIEYFQLGSPVEINDAEDDELWDIASANSMNCHGCHSFGTVDRSQLEDYSISAAISSSLTALFTQNAIFFDDALVSGNTIYAT